ncbi:LuxR C-terminal-related transcriptional regulator [Agrobacterium sp. AGB01]|uniref:LuxR C-terminal-related transcriptional regulator n=1 Tax=Agrobacterium sp. AGB01 TaxID=2769302 RepID=UPI001AED611C|nr:helix-turn-helix transcriptional regulator [Agrobacterium sp. AGB01]
MDRINEVEVMDLMLTGAMNKQIADTLGIAMRTVEAHRGKVLMKMGVRNALELAAINRKQERHKV